MLKNLGARNIVPCTVLSCAWIATGNPKQPLSCVWIDREMRMVARECPQQDTQLTVAGSGDDPAPHPQQGPRLLLLCA